ncbi:hypothetical protein CULT_630004 [[Clostridium] ultunense Esp]|nr:hypothetical protein CULT_630004 [[Clostridium] ultunense Esp]
MRNVNLLPKERRQERFLPFLILIAFFIWNLLILYTLYASQQLDRSLEDQGARLAALKQQEERLKAQLIEVSNAKKHEGATPREVLDYAAKVRLSVPKVLDETLSLLPDGGWIASLSYAQPGAIELAAGFSRMEDAAYYLNRLRHLSFAVSGISLREVKWVEGTASPTGGGQRFYQAVYTIPIAPKTLPQSENAAPGGTSNQGGTPGQGGAPVQGATSGQGEIPAGGENSDAPNAFGNLSLGEKSETGNWSTLRGGESNGAVY